MAFNDLFQQKNKKGKNPNAFSCLDTIAKTPKIPESLTIVYSIDYDIIEVDSVIKQKLSTAFAKEKELQRKLIITEELLEDASRVSVINNLTQEMEDIKQEITNLTKICTLENYIFETADLIEEYSAMPETERISNLMAGGTIKLTAGELRKKKIVDGYFEIAKKYMKIRIERARLEKDINSKQFCLSCFEVILTDVYDSKGNRI